MRPVIVDGESLSLDDVVRVARERTPVALTEDAAVRERIRASHALNDKLASEGTPIYGVTTGLGDSVDRHVGADRIARLQEGLVTMLGCGLGDYLGVEECRAILLARVNCLAKGYSAVRPELIDRLLVLLNEDVVPAIPEESAPSARAATSSLLPTSPPSSRGNARSTTAAGFAEPPRPTRSTGSRRSRSPPKKASPW